MVERRRASWGVVAAVALLAACAPSWEPAPAATNARPASLFDHPWRWTDDQANTVAFSQWRGRELVVTAIYTSCDETCPRTLAKLRQLYDQYRTEHHAAEFVIVTLDPQHDPVAELHAYKQRQHLPEAWHLVRGEPAQTHEIMELLGVHPMDMEQHLAHESRISVFDGGGVRTATLDVF